MGIGFCGVFPHPQYFDLKFLDLSAYVRFFNFAKLTKEG
jgi:hypothetical protein